ncbi:hypothetical protein [Micromonospora sp. DPT]|uniref:hypothetical protein n=1 Tax=Micromonospora sp. DPT TaxID=3142975 RepID=UPI00320990AE
MYDTWWPHLGNWGLAKLGEIKKRRVSYYVATASTLAEKAIYVRSEPLTDAELALHRPDLPFSVGQCHVLSWPAEAPESTEASAKGWRATGCPEPEALGVSEVYLLPFGPKGGERAGVRVKAENGTAFRWDELVWKASVIQAPFIRAGASVQGIGIYRSGLNRGVPAYYLWGLQSRLHDQIASRTHWWSRGVSAVRSPLGQVAGSPILIS